MEKKPLRILLIEDSLGDARLIEEMLYEAGNGFFSLEHVVRLSAGIERLVAESFDVVLLDLGLPDSQGLGALSRVREHAPQIPHILLTGLDNQELAIEAVKMGAQDYLVKGQIDPNLLVKAVRYAVERKRAEEEIRNAKDLSDAVNKINSIIDLTVDFDLVMGRVLTVSMEAVKADSAVIYLRENGSWIIRYSEGLPREIQGATFAESQISFYSFPSANGRSIVVSGEINRSMAEKYGIRAVILVPLTVRDEIIGALALHYHSAEKWFTDRQFDFANKVAALVSLALSNAKLYEDRRRAEKRFERLSRQYEVILECAGEGIYGVDREGRCTFANEAAETLVGLPVEEVTGRRTHELVHHTKPDGSPYPFEDCAIHKTLMEGTTHRVTDELFWRKDGTSFPVEFTSTPIIEDDRILGAVVTFRDVTQSKRAERALKESEQRLSLLVENLPAGALYIEGESIFFNKAVEEITGYNRSEIATLDHWFHLLYGAKAETVRGYYEEDKRSGFPSTRIVPVTRKDGEVRFVEFAAYGFEQGEVWLMHDITDRKQAEEALRKSEEKYRDLFENANDPIFIVDADLRYRDVNKRAVEMLGYAREELLGMRILDLIPPEQVSRSMEEFEKLKQEGSYKKFVGKIRKKNGEYLDIEVSASAMYEDGQYVGSTDIVRDITESKRMEELIRHQASHDALTGLPNRMLFMDHLMLTLSQARRYHETLAVMFLDLDRFKNINDTLGHAVGDRLLKAVSERIKSCLRDSDIVARIGGDEYNILLPQLAHSEDAALIAAKIVSRLDRPFAVDGHDLHVTSSIGISVYPFDGEEAPILVKNADIAMYHAKEKGRNNFQFYDPTLNVRTIERMRLENNLRHSIDRGELVVYYQPQLEVETGRIVCVEALVRWLHPELGLLSPDKFIPLAEEIGFSPALDEYVLRTACAQNKAWQQAGRPHFCVTVNLSARQFRQANLVNMVAGVLAETGLSPEYLELEISENVVMQDIEVTIPNISKLVERGIGFSIDDFGTGYSSLAYLKKLPIQRLKIDKSFIRNIVSDADDRAIVNAVIFMGHKLKLKVIAEGVETEQQMSFLRENRCDEIQGFLFSRPVPPERLEETFLG